MRFHSEGGSGSSALLSNTLKPSPVVLVEKRGIMNLVIGNTHRLVTPTAGSPNKHLWTFYLLASRPEIIKKVKVYLHDTFTPPNCIFRSPPYKITCTGWGFFSISIQVKLKRGYVWCEVDGSVLELDRILDFRSMGSSASHEYAVRREDVKY